MKRVVIVIVLLTLVIAGAMLGFFYYQLRRPAPRAADLLPDSTLLFLQVPDCAQTRAEFATTRLAALGREPAVQAFLEKPLQAIHDAVRHTGPSPEALQKQILAALQGEAFLAITHIAVVPNVKVGLVCGSDVRRNLLEARTGLVRFRRKLRAAYPKARFESKRHLGVSYDVWEFKPGFPVCHAFLNSLVIITLDEDDLRDVIARFTGRAAPTLAGNARFRDVRDQMPAEHEFLAYVNTEPVAGLLAPLLMFTPQGAGMLQKFNQIQATGYSLTFTNGDIEDLTYTMYKDAPPATNPPVARQSLALTTADTLLYAVRSMDLAAAYQQLLDTVAQTRNAAITDGIADLEHALRQRGIRLRDDVLAKLGPETTLLANWRDGARVPDFALAFQRRPGTDRAPFDAALDTLKTTLAGDVPWDETIVQGEPLRTLRVGTGIIAPTYAVTEPCLIIASSPDFARDLLGQLRQPQLTLAANRQYQEAMARLPAGGWSYAYADLPALVTRLHGLLKLYGERLPANNYVDLNKLPPAEVIAKHLSPYVSTTVTGPRHQLSISYSPVSAPSFVLAGAGIGAAVAYGSFNAVAPTTSSGTSAPPPPRGNRTAPIQTPTPR
jgi:hypothetical protein